MIVELSQNLIVFDDTRFKFLIPHFIKIMIFREK